MSRRALLALTMATSLTARAGNARVGELAVRAGEGGLPCFTLALAEEARGTPNFHSITVSEGRAALWHMAMPSQRTFPVSSLLCIPYAGRLPVLPQSPAAVLQAGRVYDVQIEARAPFAPGSARSYRVRFCLVREGGGLGIRALANGRLGCPVN